jgi:ketosteroid isomerase-like protein
MPEENVEVVRSMLGAFNRDDVDAVIAAFDEGCEIREPLEMPDSPAMGYRGHDGIREWMRNLRGVARAGFEPRRFTSRGDVLLCELASRTRAGERGANRMDDLRGVRDAPREDRPDTSLPQ